MGERVDSRGNKVNARTGARIAPSQPASSPLPATPGLTFQVIDNEVILQYVGSLGRQVRKIARQTLMKAGKPMLAAIKARVRRLTGTLARGLRLRIGRGDRKNRYSVLITSWTTREAFAAVLSRGVAKRVRQAGQARDRYRVWYATPLEKGHANARGGGRTPPYPFLAPGFEETVDMAYQTAEQALLEAAANA
ncbi:MAG TPA: HK97 gp10 family phage protein [Phycisphaerae bacterium]|nr:HK97 gp10 family phage protein [Phycisphaerae bacterium]